MTLRYNNGSVLSTMPAEPGWRLRLNNGLVYPVVMWAVVVSWADEEIGAADTHVEAVVAVEGGAFLTNQYWLREDEGDPGRLVPPDSVLDQIEEEATS